MTPEQYGAHLASLAEPPTREQILEAARILASVELDAA